jgi:transcriptional regulator with XRE-family HTH domain
MGDTTESQAEVAARLRMARENAGLSQGQVAKLMNLHRPTVCEIEAGRRRVTAGEIASFAGHYEVDVDWLLGARRGATDPRIELAARELAKLDPDDMRRLLELLRTLKTR